MRFTSTLSTHANPNTALSEAAASAVLNLGDAPADIAFLFMSGYISSDLEAAAKRVREITNARHLIGCTAGGVVGGGREIEHRPSTSLTLASLPNVNIRPFHVAPTDYPNPDAPPSAWHGLINVRPEEHPSFILLPDPFTAEPQILVSGLDYAYPNSIKIGGLASGGNSEGANRLFINDEALREGAVGVSLTGDLSVETVVAQGCKPVGAPGKITKVKGFFLMEVDGKPAIDFIQEQIEAFSTDDRDLARIALFVGIAMNPFSEKPLAQGDFLIRNIMGVDREHGYVAVGAQLTAGRMVQLHVRDRETSSEDLLDVLRRSQTGTPAAAGALLFSCLGRGQHLYGEADKDSKLFRSVVGEVPLGGFFCNGEIGPVGGETYIHGFTSSFGLFKTPARSR